MGERVDDGVAVGPVGVAEVLPFDGLEHAGADGFGDADVHVGDPGRQDVGVDGGPLGSVAGS